MALIYLIHISVSVIKRLLSDSDFPMVALVAGNPCHLGEKLYNTAKSDMKIKKFSNVNGRITFDLYKKI